MLRLPQKITSVQEPRTKARPILHIANGNLFDLSLKRRILHSKYVWRCHLRRIVVEETIHAMKRAIILGSALSVVTLMLASCASEPEATTTTTRQTTVTTPVAPPASQTTTTTTHMGGRY
jgi:hypothetical protein